ncbi:MAG: LCP family protein [Candidatus Flexifilum sp.]
MRIPGWMFLLGVVALVGATAVCSVGAYTTARQIAVDLGSSGVAVASFSDFLRAQPTATFTPPPPPTLTPAPGETPPPATPDQAAIPAGPTPTVDPLAAYTWDDPRRINILLLGIDQRTGEEGAFRTDTIIVASIDPVRRTVGLLSIPRDLWVPIPGFQPGRINTANYLGDINAYPGGGPALAARTITENLGIEIDKYVRVNFDVFTTLVDLVAPNGVEVCPTEVIDDPTYPDAGYGTIHVHFDPGCQRLDSTRLLQYARTRATQGSDFDRAARQQEVIRAVQNEVLNAGGIANFFTQIPALWERLSGAYTTNLTLDEILSLAALASQIPRENVTSGTINTLHVNLATSPDGQQVLIPRYTAIRALIQQVFNPQPDLSLDDLRARAEREEASIAIYNNTTITGLAGQTRDWLSARGVAITAVGNTPELTNGLTVIRDYTGNLWTARYLAALLGLPADRIEPGSDGLTGEDILIVAGTDMPSLLNR